MDPGLQPLMNTLQSCCEHTHTDTHILNSGTWELLMLFKAWHYFRFTAPLTARALTPAHTMTVAYQSVSAVFECSDPMCSSPSSPNTA